MLNVQNNIHENIPTMSVVFKSFYIDKEFQNSTIIYKNKSITKKDKKHFIDNIVSIKR